MIPLAVHEIQLCLVEADPVHEVLDLGLTPLLASSRWPEKATQMML